MTKRVLLADDQPDNRIIFRSILEYGGYHVILAADGSEAVDRARRELPDLILMDLMMPGMDGWAAIGDLQRNSATAAIPIVAISAHGRDDGVAREARLAGCRGYLAKPINPRSLLDAVHRWFEDPEQPGWMEIAPGAPG
jgi:two-component system, cell cycle response regulator DivK